LFVFAKTFVSGTFVLGTETNYSTERLFWVGITNCQTAKLKLLLTRKTFVSNKPFRLKKLAFRNVSLKAMKLTFRAALHLGLAMLWQLFHNYSPSFLSVGIANDLSNCLAMLWQQFHIHHPSFLSASPMTRRTACPMTQIAVRFGLARTLLFRTDLFVGPAMLWHFFHIHHPAQFWSASPCNFGFQSHMTHSTLARHRH